MLDLCITGEQTARDLQMKHHRRKGRCGQDAAHQYVQDQHLLENKSLHKEAIESTPTVDDRFSGTQGVEKPFVDASCEAPVEKPRMAADTEWACDNPEFSFVQALKSITSIKTELPF